MWDGPRTKARLSWAVFSTVEVKSPNIPGWFAGQRLILNEEGTAGKGDLGVNKWVQSCPGQPITGKWGRIHQQAGCEQPPLAVAEWRWLRMELVARAR